MEKLTKAKDQFSTLKKNSQLFSFEMRLRMASAIRNNIVADKDIEEACAEDNDLSVERKIILDEIKSYQHEIISKVTTTGENYEETESIIINDFASANADLNRIASDEVEKGITSNNPLTTELQEVIDHDTTLGHIVDRGINSTYTVLIMGEYQTGKTTFVDSLVGKHVGAIGDGNTTSAVPLTISYGNETKVNVEWKTDTQIMSMLTNLSKYIDGFDIDTFDLSDSASREFALKKIDDLRHDKTCPNAKEPGCKTLAICSILLKFYGNKNVEDLKNKELSTLNISEISRFPKEIETRWHKRGSATFSWQESIFAFIYRINCFVPSERLAKLNCTIVDSPGLFSNAYDTQVTEREMINADAILYLLPYYAEMGEDTTGSLYLINRNYEFIHRKLFIINNWDYSDFRKKFYQSNCDTIHAMFGENMNICRVDARLAYLGELKKSFDLGLLSNDEIQRFIKNAEDDFSEEDDERIEFNNFSDAWDEYVHVYKRRCKWDTPTADDVIEKSGIIEAVSSLRKFVENNEAYSIVYANGIAKLAKEMLNIKKALQIKYVEPYLMGRFALERIWQDRIERSTVFSEAMPSIVDKHLFKSLDNLPSLHHRLTDIVYNQLFTEDSYNNLIAAICREIYDNKWNLAKCGKNQTKIKNLIEPKIESVVTREIKYKVDSWNDLIKTNQDVNFISTFKTQIQLLKNELERKWKEIYGDDEVFCELVDRYSIISEETSKFTIANNSSHGGGMSTNNISIASSLMGDIASLVAIIVVFITPTVITIASAIASNPTGWFVGITIAVGGSFYWMATGDDIMEKKFIGYNGPKIKKLFVEKDLCSKFKQFIESEIETVLKNYKNNSVFINMKMLEDDRDVSLSTPPESVEDNCFKTVCLLTDINSQLETYNHFIESYTECLK